MNNHSQMRSLYARTLGLLEETALTKKAISDGAGVQLRWLQNLVAGKYKDPGVNKVERVHDFLASHKAGRYRMGKPVGPAKIRSKASHAEHQTDSHEAP